MKQLLVVAEHKAGKLTKATKELCSIAGKFSHELKSETTALILSEDDSPVHEATGIFPNVFHVPVSMSPDLSPSIIADIVGQIAEKNEISAVLLPHSYTGIYLAPWIACGLNSACITGCDSISMEEGKIICTRPVYNGKLVEKRIAVTDCPVCTMQQGICGEEPCSLNGKIIPLIHEKTASQKPKIEFLRRQEGSGNSKILEKASIVVGGGRGLKNKERFMETVIALAEILRGEYAGTRPVIDSGWVGPERQIGQSGVSIAPDLYIAIGISGSIQHISGIRDSKCIVAINTDPDAPIFQYSDYGVVCDYSEFVPALIEALKDY